MNKKQRNNNQKKREFGIRKQGKQGYFSDVFNQIH